MSANFYDLLKYAATGIAAPSMTYYDKMRASTLMGGVVQTLTGQPPLSFKSDGTPLISLSMKGNEQQSGTPTHDNPVMPTFCGKLVGTDWTIPITCAGQTTPVYLGQVSTTRRIKKLVLTGGNTETWGKSQSTNTFYLTGTPDVSSNRTLTLCSHFVYSGATKGESGTYYTPPTASHQFNFAWIDSASLDDWKSYLAAQYAAGTPVVVWYVLAEPETGIVNEPLMKIGDYCDTLTTDTPIPTAKGSNTLTVDTTVQPSEVSITGNIKPTT